MQQNPASGMAGFWELLDADAAAAVDRHARLRSYARGDALMHAGQVPQEVIVLRSGRVKVSATTPAGRRVLLAFRGPGDLVGEMSAIDEQPRGASVEALEPVEAIAIGHQHFRAVLRDQPAASLALLRVLADRLREADAKRIQLTGYTTMGRVAFCLLELCERFGAGDEGPVDILLPLSQEELAGWAGSSLESVARSLQSMRGLGWIETRRRAIRVLDRDALRTATA
jgi:CRP/FNR family transcriptional regulator, cyclic AMP receptor protein